MDDFLWVECEGEIIWRLPLSEVNFLTRSNWRDIDVFMRLASYRNANMETIKASAKALYLDGFLISK